MSRRTKDRWAVFELDENGVGLWHLKDCSSFKEARREARLLARQIKDDRGQMAPDIGIVDMIPVGVVK